MVQLQAQPPLARPRIPRAGHRATLAGLVAGHVEGGKASSQLRATTEPAGLNWRRVGRVGRVTTP
jgi:hypothetical protein